MTCWPEPRALFRHWSRRMPWPKCIKRAPRMKKSEVVVVNISGRGDKDIGILRENLKIES